MCKEKLLSTTDNSLLSYVGAAVLGIILSLVFHLFTLGLPIEAISLYVAYTIFITIISSLCHKSCSACKFNEFWLSLEQLASNKLKSINS